MADINDIARMGFVLDRFTDAQIIPRSSLDDDTAKLTRAWNNSDNFLAPLVRFSMPVNGTYYVVEAVPDSKSKVMTVITAYMKSGAKKDSNLNQVLNLPGDPTSSLTPEAHLDSVGAVSGNIPQPGETVNTPSEVAVGAPHFSSCLSNSAPFSADMSPRRSVSPVLSVSVPADRSTLSTAPHASA